MKRPFIISIMQLMALSLSILFQPIVLGATSQEEISLLDGSHDGVLQFVKKYLPNDPIIIEAGAFDGTDSIKMAKKWPKSKLYAFEPVLNGFNKLINKTKNFDNISCFQLALGDFSGKAVFYVSDFVGYPDFDTACSSILPPKQHLEYGGDVRFDNKEEVDVILFDEWAANNCIDKVDLMWLDMQGYELNMLQQSKVALTAKIIYMEMEFVEAYEGQFLYEDVVDWMKKNGFKIIAIDFEPDQPYQKIEPSQYYPPGRAWFGNGVFINERYFKSSESPSVKLPNNCMEK